MGKSEARQSKLAFEGNRQMCQMEPEGAMEDPHRRQQSTFLQDPDLKEMLLDVKNSLQAINAKIDLLTSCLDLMKEWVDKHNVWLDELKACVSDPEDTQTTAGEHLLHMNKEIKVIKLKNKGLAACCRHYNLRIIVSRNLQL
ncbi:hypothetical protein NDU88_007861 [Pleurodeles waltl]|uniref:Uncharacterized protein n=1 Tax=Pleurodeles waltl TaxID=8319 RepID=A0AAV7QQ11_PLEWA|nr:hypothetical protein NDU88_007861 [Pleurodeles waltl]